MILARGVTACETDAQNGADPARPPSCLWSRLTDRISAAHAIATKIDALTMNANVGGLESRQSAQ